MKRQVLMTAAVPLCAASMLDTPLPHHHAGIAATLAPRAGTRGGTRVPRSGGRRGDERTIRSIGNV
ncbi:hypothetical protein [Streptosporangium sp. H16]|uniref:hypothetical protein n=1 Tax=Streptosporangium sp. H16 TaxID=3444184 RepID=UPI003F7B3378